MRQGSGPVLLPPILVCQATSSKPRLPAMPQQVTPTAHAFLGARRRLGPLAPSSQPPLLTGSGQTCVALSISPAMGSRWIPLGLPFLIAKPGRQLPAPSCLRTGLPGSCQSQTHAPSILVCPLSSLQRPPPAPSRLALPADFITTISAVCHPGVRHAAPFLLGGPGLPSPVPSEQKPTPCSPASAALPTARSHPAWRVVGPSLPPSVLFLY